MFKKAKNRMIMVIKVRKKRVAAIAVALAVVLIFFSISNPAIVGTSATTRLLPIYCVQRDNKAVSLSFDAAWGNEDTEQLIEILEKYGVKATFFVVGQWVDKYPESVLALHEAGHEVMNHSDDHAHFASLTAAQITANVNACNDKIEAVTGVRPTLFRPPYGEYDDNVIATLGGMGMYTIQWDVES
jgi:peptidoglycan/xylan/chitin deacetylase (PgdA/CDA1 family)